ncbi:S41 family peptidase [Mesonia sp. MT50]|uniref:S41 family peptidase n=1 Tax=Mesonia profundi TaxID=3070998 RepID=A0ABU1A2X4_9FLAO|nr:S41 family peptidase [Mesonia profundi]MDQ7918063.1 S41 family peptidase [Mesonia profundi]
MKKISIIIFVLTFTYSAKAQELSTSQDSIGVFYDKLFSVMKKEYLYKEEVNWKEIEPKIRENLTPYSDFQSSLQEITTLFDFAKADHSAVYYKDDRFSGTPDGPTEKDFSDQWLKKFATQPVFEVKVLDHQFGYILMPGMRSEKNIHEQSQLMYDEINKIKSSENLKGWIIDLRFNTGGDIWPMLLPLYDFLGNNVVWGEMDIHKNQINKIKLKKGKYKSNSKTVSYINPKGELLDHTKVAVITNIATGSSGEITALAFKGRENTIFIGEKTNGKTTTNYRRNLPFGAYMTLTMGYDCDRNEKFYEYIIPDIHIVKQDNFENLLLDKNIQEAIKFISITE